jgi:bacteriorhodopsin
MANHALDLNPPNAAIHISVGGSDWLWAAFSLITTILLVIVGLNFLVCAI